MGFLQLLKVLWARRMLIVALLAVIVTAVAIVSIQSPKVFVATTSVVVDSRSVDPITGSQQPAQLVNGVRATQIDVISSRAVAGKVAETLHLESHPAFEPALPMSAEARRIDVTDRLMRRLGIKPSRDSNVIEIQIEDEDPVLAAEVANAYAAAYIETSLQLQMDPMRRQSVWFDEQLSGLRKALESAQARLAAYQQRESLVVGTDRLDVENARLAEISSQLVGAQADLADARTRLRQAAQAIDEDRLGELPDVLANPLLQTLRADFGRAEAKFAEIRERYARNHPQFISAAAEVAALRGRITAEARTAQASIRQAAEMAERRVGEMQRTLDQQRDRILGLQDQRDGLDVLNREVENAQRAYDTALERASEIRLQSELNQSSIAVLNAAVPPASPDRPNVIRNLLMAVVLGALMSAGVALIIELFDRRIRSGADLTQAAHLPVLAELPALPKAPRRAALPDPRLQPEPA